MKVTNGKTTFEVSEYQLDAFLSKGFKVVEAKEPKENKEQKDEKVK